MSLTPSMPAGRPKRWRDQAWVQLVAVVVGVVPLYSTLIILQVRAGLAVSVQGFIFYLAVICPLSIAVALLLLRFLCGESPRELNLRPGRVSSDLLGTLILSVVVIVANATSTFLLSVLLPESPSNASVITLFAKLAEKPWLLALFVGLLLLLGAASEELIRAFLLSRLWKLWPSLSGNLAGIVISVGLFSLIHLHQGPVHVIWTVIFGLIMALYYLRFGRVVPLILAHYVTNALQVVLVAARER